MWYALGTNTFRLLLCTARKRYVPNSRPPAQSDRHILTIRWLPPRNRFEGRIGIATQLSWCPLSTTFWAVATRSTSSRAPRSQCWTA